jgi:ribA/ribD-fused uncharacterized protein
MTVDQSVDRKRKRDSSVPDKIKFFAANEKFGVLSNFFVLPKPVFTPSGVACATSEHLYHALKYEYDDAPEANAKMVAAIARASTPYKAKVIANAGLGRPCTYAWQRALVSQAKVFLDAGAAVRSDIDADAVRIDMMRQCIRAKFENNPHCRAALVATAPADLIEASPYDSFWGIGRQGTGHNHLGKLLMELRDHLADTD